MDNVSQIIEELSSLKKKEKLLKELLKNYDIDSKQFDIKEKWTNSSNIRKDKLPAKTPKDKLAKDIAETFDDSNELAEFLNIDEQTAFDFMTQSFQ